MIPPVKLGMEAWQFASEDNVTSSAHFVMTGAVLSITFTVNEQLSDPALFVAVQVTVVVPTGNVPVNSPF